MIPYGYVQMVLVLQLVLWMYLYGWREVLGVRAAVVFYLGYVGVAALLLVYKPIVGHFTTWIMLQYATHIVLAVSVMRLRFRFQQALCLGFLIVWFNSFYWEFFYHVHEFQVWLPASLGWVWWYLRIPQWLRVVPWFWLGGRGMLYPRRWLVLGLLVGYPLTWAALVGGYSAKMIHPFHRLICLGCLLATVWGSDTVKNLEVNV